MPECGVLTWAPPYRPQEGLPYSHRASFIPFGVDFCCLYLLAIPSPLFWQCIPMFFVGIWPLCLRRSRVLSGTPSLVYRWSMWPWTNQTVNQILWPPRLVQGRTNNQSPKFVWEPTGKYLLSFLLEMNVREARARPACPLCQHAKLIYKVCQLIYKGNQHKKRLGKKRKERGPGVKRAQVIPDAKLPHVISFMCYKLSLTWIQLWWNFLSRWARKSYWIHLLSLFYMLLIFFKLSFSKGWLLLFSKVA